MAAVCAHDEETAKKISNKINVPTALPGFDALGMTAPILVQLNPNGKWESSSPQGLDEDKLKEVVQQLIQSKALAAAQSYCSQCAAEAQKQGGASNYVPVIMMPIFSADQCPFDMDCEVQKMKKSDMTKSEKGTKKQDVAGPGKKDEPSKKVKKRGYVLQRLTDFDLLSQW